MSKQNEKESRQETEEFLSMLEHLDVSVLQGLVEISDMFPPEDLPAVEAELARRGLKISPTGLLMEIE